MDHRIVIDSDGEMYLQDVPGMTLEDKDLTEAEIREKYFSEKPNRWTDFYNDF